MLKAPHLISRTYISRTNIRSITQRLLFHLFLDKPKVDTSWALFSNILSAPNITNLRFLNLGPIMSSLVWQQHYITEICKSKKISGGACSIRQQKLFLFHKVKLVKHKISMSKRTLDWSTWLFAWTKTGPVLNIVHNV